MENILFKKNMQRIEEIALQNGYCLNSDKERLNKVIELMTKNVSVFGKPYCPCKQSKPLNPEKDTLCPCIDLKREIEEMGHCYCKLFFRKGEENSKKIKLTSYGCFAGCAGKLEQEKLKSIIDELPKFKDSRIIAGQDFSDDAAIIQINENTTIVQTVDFFSPVVDDPYDFGVIVAANSVSDIYAMGATPVLALNVLCMPGDIDKNIIKDILRGGIDTAKEAEFLIVGGHTMKDKEIKYGLAVTGILDKGRYTPITGAKVDDLLVLCKPLGTGIITTGIKSGVVDEKVEKNALDVMKMLNKKASELMIKHKAHAATDITGFGFLGHAMNIAEASDVSFEIFSEKVPVIQGTEEILEKGIYPAGSSMNRIYLEPKLKWEESVQENLKKILVDAQTSGGLLVSIPADEAELYLKELKENGYIQSEIIGRVINKNKEFRIRIF